MRTVTDNIRTQDGLQLHTIKWLTNNQSRAIVVLVHGIGEHAGRYQHVADWLTARGYAVYALDHRGHGKSEGERVYFTSFAQPTNDLANYVDIIIDENPDTPLFVYGHSMGALISLLFVLDNQNKLAGWISSATPLTLDLSQPRIMVSAGIALSKFFPKAQLLSLDRNGLSRDQSVISAYEADPLVYQKPTRLGVAASLIAHARQARQDLNRLRLPVLAMHGTSDIITPSSGSQLIIDSASSKDKTLKLYQGFFHELHNEPEQSQVLTDITDWLDAR